MNDRIFVQYGCGLSAPDGWVNYDASPTLRIKRMPVVGNAVAKLAGADVPFPASVRYGDIVAGLPHAPGSVAGLYASHVLEHLARDDMRAALANSFRILAPGGIFRLIVPDLKWRADNYVARAANDDPEASLAFMHDTLLGLQQRARGLKGKVRALFGNADHLWMWDYAGMKGELERAGFTQVRRAALGDSREPMFDRVEDEGRFFDNGRAEVAIEARKPA